MKKLIVLVAVLLAALFVVGCASKPSAPPAPTGPSAAELLAEAKGKAPMGVLVGQATGSSQPAAQTNAQGQLKRAMNYIAGQLVDAQVSAGRVSSAVSADLKSNIATALDRGAVENAKRVDSGADGSGRGWAVYSLDKASALQLITTAADAAKTVVAAGNFNPSQGYDDAFGRAAAMEWK